MADTDQPKFTSGPWNICWSEYNGRKVNFEITASPYGSVRPLCRSDWKTDWSEVEGEELVANAHLMVASPDLYDSVKALLHLIPADQQEISPICRLAKAALAKAEGRS